MNAANDWSTISQDKLDALAASLMPIEMLKEKLIHNEKGNVTQVIENCETVIREDELLKGAVRLNRMTGRLEIQKDMGWSRAGPAVNDNDMNNILSYMARNYDLRADKLCWRAVSTAAYENGFHPIRDYLEGLEWDGTERIRHALRHFLGAPEDELTYQCMKMFMIGALRRIYEPGCKFEYVLTLVGGQGIGKSTFFRFLAIQDKWFTDDLVGFKSSRIFEKISGHWIIEMSEMLAIMNAKGADEVKSFLSRQSDVYRDPYAVFPDDRPRQCVFGATTNRAKCLPFDRTGNRRFLPVLVDEAQAEVHILENEAESRAYIDQMWAEAMTLYRAGDYTLKFPKDIEKQLNALRREFMAEDTNAGMIQMYLDGYEGDYVCVAQIYQEALHNPFTDPSRRDSIEITDIMRHSIEGWQPGPVHRFEKYGRQRSWVRVNQVCQPSASDPQAAVPDDDGFIEVPDDPDNPFITKDEPLRTRPP